MYAFIYLIFHLISAWSGKILNKFFFLVILFFICHFCSYRPNSFPIRKPDFAVSDIVSDFSGEEIAGAGIILYVFARTDIYVYIIVDT